MKKTIKICLLWHNINSENFGVSALAIAHIKMLIDAAKKNDIHLKIYCLGTPNINGLGIRQEVEDVLNISIEHINFSAKEMVKGFFSINGFKDKYFDYDLYFDIGEGDSFSDIYGLKRFLILSLSKILPIIKRKKVILAPQTYGPFYSKVSQIISSIILKKSYKVYSRDFKSSKLLKELGCDYKEVADVAFSLPYEKKEDLLKSVGLNVSALLYNGGYTGDNQFNLKVDYKKLIIDIIDYYLGKGYEVHLVPHVLSESFPIEDDYETSIKIKNDHYFGNDKVILPERFSSPIDAKSYISSLSLFLGSRMHATIGAISSEVPTIPLAYSRKFSGVFGSINYNYTLNLYDLDNLECMKSIESLTLKKMDLRKASISSKENALCSNLEYQNMLEELFLNHD